MPNAVQEAREVIEKRLRALEDQASQLRAALKQLGTDSRSSPGSRTTSRSKVRSTARSGGQARSRSRRRTKRAPRGLREQQFLAAVEKAPGAKVPAIAAEIGVSPNQGYALASRLVDAGKVRKGRGGYVVKGARPRNRQASSSGRSRAS